MLTTMLTTMLKKIVLTLIITAFSAVSCSAAAPENIPANADNVFAAIKAVPQNYTNSVKTGGKIEAKYLAMGRHEVSYMESPAMMSFKKFEIYYPSDIAKIKKTLPAVIFVNGTGVKGTSYPALQKHLASWGFLTVATDEEFAWNGFSAEMSTRYLELLNEYQPEKGQNLFYHKINLNNLGVTGHSQGGFGVVNAITEQRHHQNYKAAVILSCNAQSNPALLWEAHPAEITAPTLILGSTGTVDSFLAPLDSLQLLYSQIPNDVWKVLARRKNADHGEMLYQGDGYVTAWFMWLLKGDEKAAKAFTGNSPELLNNNLYQDQQISIR